MGGGGRRVAAEDAVEVAVGDAAGERGRLPARDALGGSGQAVPDRRLDQAVGRHGRQHGRSGRDDPRSRRAGAGLARSTIGGQCHR